jgi:hypothetical protein
MLKCTVSHSLVQCRTVRHCVRQCATMCDNVRHCSTLASLCITVCDTVCDTVRHCVRQCVQQCVQHCEITQHSRSYYHVALLLGGIECRTVSHSVAQGRTQCRTVMNRTVMQSDTKIRSVAECRTQCCTQCRTQCRTVSLTVMQVSHSDASVAKWCTVYHTMRYCTKLWDTVRHCTTL